MKVESINGVEVGRNGINLTTAESLVSSTLGELTIVAKECSKFELKNMIGHKATKQSKLGIYYKPDLSDGSIMITKVFSRSIFEDTELKPNTTIVSVNGVSVGGFYGLGMKDLGALFANCDGDVVIVGHDSQTTLMTEKSVGGPSFHQHWIFPLLMAISSCFWGISIFHCSLIEVNTTAFGFLTGELDKNDPSSLVCIYDSSTGDLDFNDDGFSPLSFSRFAAALGFSFHVTAYLFMLCFHRVDFGPYGSFWAFERALVLVSFLCSVFVFAAFLSDECTQVGMQCTLAKPGGFVAIANSLVLGVLVLYLGSTLQTPFSKYQQIRATGDGSFEDSSVGSTERTVVDGDDEDLDFHDQDRLL